MKKVFNNREVCRRWANRTQESARNFSGSLFFYGDIIYSYGAHFPIAKHIVNKRGERAVLFTSRDYSRTTTNHKWAVKRALYRSRIFHVADICAGHAQCISEFVTRIDEAKLNLYRGRIPWRRHWRRRHLSYSIEEANDYARFFDLSIQFFQYPEERIEAKPREEEQVAWPLKRRRFPASIREQATKCDVIDASVDQVLG